MFSSISPGKQGNVGKADCSDLCQLWVSIKSKCACQQFLHRSFTASSLLGIEKENHLPISNFDLSLSISHPNTRTSLLCSQRSCNFINLFALDTTSNLFPQALCVFWCLCILYTPSTRWRGFLSLKYEGCLFQHPRVWQNLTLGT